MKLSIHPLHFASSPSISYHKTMTGPNQHQLNLWLRAEKAMGLSWVPQGVSPPVSAALPAIQTQPLSKPPLPRSVPVKLDPPNPKSAHQPVAIGGGVMFQSPALSPMEQLLDGPVLPTEEKRRLLADMDAGEVQGCVKCRLCETRTHTVFGDGDPDAKIFFIGEGPGENEDLTGRPFVGKAGQLLDNMITAMGLTRQTVYISNIVKCRPPGNRVPMSDEVSACTPYLVRQLQIIRPQVIVTLGLPAAQYMLANPKLKMGAVRGRWHNWRGIKLMPTYHPSYVLRSYTPEVRGMVWGDLKAVMLEAGPKPAS